MRTVIMNERGAITVMNEIVKYILNCPDEEKQLNALEELRFYTELPSFFWQIKDTALFREVLGIYDQIGGGNKLIIKKDGL